MFDVGCHKQHIAGLKPLPLAGRDKISLTGHHHINLVASMRFLRVLAARCIELHAQRPMLEEFNKSLTLGARQFSESFGDCDGMELRHAHYFLTLSQKTRKDWAPA